MSCAFIRRFAGQEAKRGRAERINVALRAPAGFDFSRLACSGAHVGRGAEVPLPSSSPRHASYDRPRR